MRFSIHMVWMLVLAVLGSGISGCAGKQGPAFSLPSESVHLNSAARSGSSLSWWAVRFRFAWPEDQAWDRGLDGMMAHAVVMPVLNKYTSNIETWRFHRRAARGAAGHQFSFLFFSDSGVADAVFSEIGRSDLLQAAMDAGIVEKFRTDDPARPLPGGIAGMSDEHWSDEMQRQWPQFIHGASAVWLGLVEEHARILARNRSDGTEAMGIEEMAAFYREVEDAVASVWYAEAQHAFFHHLNAIFGYQPMRVQKRMTW